MYAARQWEFEAPPKAPAHTQIEMTYSLTKSCPEGKGSDQGDIVTTIVPTEEHEGDLKILGKVAQPRPPYPEAARAERRRGQLYLSIVVNPDGSVSEASRMFKLRSLWTNYSTSQQWKRFALGGSKFLPKEGQQNFQLR
jgi:hypothetical protein